MKVGITGHQRLKAASWDWTIEKLREIVESFDVKITGISSLAIGADQIFSEIVLNSGGNLIAVLPFKEIEETFKAGDLNNFKNLASQAKKTITLERCSDDEISFFNAGKKVIELSDEVVAVWDEQPAKGLGGTGDIVQYAQKQGKSIIIINPYSKKITNF